MAGIEAKLLNTKATFERIWTLCCNEAAEGERGRRPAHRPAGQ